MDARLPGAMTADALRAVYRTADKSTRQTLKPILPPQEIAFAGVRMQVDPRDNYTENRIWCDGVPPEVRSLRALADLVKGRRALVLDVGANCGAFAVPLGSVLGDGGRVIAFEPNPVMIGRLGHNVALNGLSQVVRIESCALGATRGEATLHRAGNNLGQASLFEPTRRRGAGMVVPVRLLTEFLEGCEAYDLTVLKIDVEGAEPEVLAPLVSAGGPWPDAILMETRHSTGWRSDAAAGLRANGYDAAPETEGNTLFTRGARDK